jgi:hypothetical protein
MGQPDMAITPEQRAEVERQLQRTDLRRRVRERLEMVKAAALGAEVARIARWSGRAVETVDGMSLEKIAGLIALIRREAYRWTPVRRTHIPKARGGRARSASRPGVTNWCRKSCASSWKRTTNLASARPRTDSVRTMGATPRCRRSPTGPGRSSSSRVTSKAALTTSTTRSCCPSWPRRSTITASCA